MEQWDQELQEKSLLPLAAAAGIAGGVALGLFGSRAEPPYIPANVDPPKSVTPVTPTTIPPVASQTSTGGYGPYTRAMLDTISDGEGTSKYEKGGYNTLFGGAQVEDLTKHPKTSVLYNRGRDSSNAFGRYQIIGKTYDWLKGESMHPEEQDKMAVKLLQYRLKVKTPEAVEEFLKTNKMSQHTSTMLSREWASFPGDDGNSVYRDQSVQRLEKLQSHWDKNIEKHIPTAKEPVKESYQYKRRKYVIEALFSNEPKLDGSIFDSGGEFAYNAPMIPHEPGNPVIEPTGSVFEHSNEERSHVRTYDHTLPVLDSNNKPEGHLPDIEVRSIGRSIGWGGKMIAYHLYTGGQLIHTIHEIPSGQLLHAPMRSDGVESSPEEEKIHEHQGQLLKYLNIGARGYKKEAERIVKEHKATMVDNPSLQYKNNISVSDYHATK